MLLLAVMTLQVEAPALRAESRPSKLRLAAEFTVAGTPDWLITEYNVRQPHITEVNWLGQTTPRRALLTAAYVAGATFLTDQAYDVSPRFGRVVRWTFVVYKALLFLWNVGIHVGE